MIRRAAAISGSILVLMGCPPPGAPTGNGKGTNVEIADVIRPDAAPEATGDDGPPVQPGSEGDVIGRVFALGTEPALPSAFGKLQPWMTRAEAKKVLPSDWGGAWSRTLPGEDNVIVSVGDAEGGDDPIEHLDVTFDQAGAAWRLEQAWGPPALRAYDKSASCWLATSARLKACHTKVLGRDVIEIAKYVPLSEALGKSGGRAFMTLAARLGQAKADVQRAFPLHEAIVDEKDPKKNRIEITFPSTDYMASAHADRVLLYLDAEDRVTSISVRFGANDPEVRPAALAEIRKLTDAIANDESAPDVTVLEGEPLDLVVVLDRHGALE